MPPCLSLRDWYESGKSLYSDQTYRLPYLPTPVSPFHAEPLQFLTTTIAIPRFEYTFNCSRSASLVFVSPEIPFFENKMPNRDLTESRKYAVFAITVTSAGSLSQS